MSGAYDQAATEDGEPGAIHLTYGHSNDKRPDLKQAVYPDFAHTAAKQILAGAHDRGILICGTGVGMAMSANRHAGIRAVNCSDVFTARYARTHNDANVLTLGGRVVGYGLAWEIVKMWLTTPFSGDKRHVRRVTAIEPR